MQSFCQLLVVLFCLFPVSIFAAEPPLPADVANRIVNQLGEAAGAAAEILKDPQNYEEGTNPNSKGIAKQANVDDSGQLAFSAMEVDYASFLETKPLKKYKKFAQNRIAVPVFRVAFVIQTKASAHSMSGFDRSRGGISSSLTVTLGGIDAAVMQETTDRAYQDYLARLTAAGFDVVSFSEIKQTSGYQKIKFVPDGYSKSANGTTYLVFTPTGMPLFWDFGNVIGNAGLSTGQPFNRISSETLSTVILPTLVVNFAEMSSSGRKFAATSASVGAEMGITLNEQSTYHLRVGHPKMSTAVTFMGDARVKESFSVVGDFGEMREVGSSDDRALMGLLSLGMGTALSSRVSETRIVSAEPKAYQQLALTALASGNEAFVEALADAKNGELRKKQKARR
tara:strand:+ start:5966 stop:7153 length:1188 start_codon:yes stop_codon:yes gene_type:complete